MKLWRHYETRWCHIVIKRVCFNHYLYFHLGYFCHEESKSVQNILPFNIIIHWANFIIWLSIQIILMDFTNICLILFFTFVSVYKSKFQSRFGRSFLRQILLNILRVELNMIKIKKSWFNMAETSAIFEPINLKFESTILTRL